MSGLCLTTVIIDCAADAIRSLLVAAGESNRPLAVAQMSERSCFLEFQTIQHLPACRFSS
jgi:hypothetical protein